MEETCQYIMCLDSNLITALYKSFTYLLTYLVNVKFDTSDSAFCKVTSLL